MPSSPKLSYFWQRELLHDKPPKGAFEIFTGAPTLITRLEVIKGANLGSLKSRGAGSAASSPYCKVFCESASCTGFVVRRNNNPTWNEPFLFYRIKPAKNPIRIEVSTPAKDASQTSTD